MHRRSYLGLVSGLLSAGCLAENSDGDDSPAKSPSMRLHISNEADEEVEMVLFLQEVASGSTVYNRTISFAPGDFVSLDETFEAGIDYIFSMKSGDATVFETEIPSYKGVQLAIKGQHAVVVVNQVER